MVERMRLRLQVRLPCTGLLRTGERLVRRVEGRRGCRRAESWRHVGVGLRCDG
jgi:hypothetical protein